MVSSFQWTLNSFYIRASHIRQAKGNSTLRRCKVVNIIRKLCKCKLGWTSYGLCWVTSCSADEVKLLHLSLRHIIIVHQRFNNDSVVVTVIKRKKTKNLYNILRKKMLKSSIALKGYRKWSILRYNTNLFFYFIISSKLVR